MQFQCFARSIPTRPGLPRKTRPSRLRQRQFLLRANVMKPEDVAKALLKGMAKKKFVIIPNADGRFTYIMKRLLPGLVELVTDAQARKARQEK